MTTGDQSYTNFPDVQLPFLPPNTIVPNPVEDTDNFIQYFNRLYEEIAFAVNSKDFDWFTIPISTTPKDIPNVDNRGAYLVSVTGTLDGMPSANFSLVKADKNQNGIDTTIQQQAGTKGVWTGVKILITKSDNTNFQISTDAVTGTVGNFNINIMGTL